MIEPMSLENMFSCDLYPKRKICLQEGRDALVFDIQGKSYIDCVAGHGVASVGHCNEQVVAAITKQAQKLLTCTGTFYNETRAHFLQKLIQITPANLKRVFLCNSGTESIEAALKLARYSTGKSEFICALRSFHGRTMGSLSATFNPHYKKDFLPLIPGFHFIPFNQFDKLAEIDHKNIAAVILEVVQGEGGVHVGGRQFFQKVRQWCDEFGVLLILDEVQTGFCRTGKMFACDHFALRPDMMCVAKAMGGGFPVGALLCSEKIKDPQGKHGSTFGGNPLACAAALATIQFMEDYQLADQARKKGEYLLQKFRGSQLKKIKEVRGMGLMIGLELAEAVKPYVLALIDEGILTLPAGKNVLRLLPPLVITHAQLDQVFNKICQCLSK